GSFAAQFFHASQGRRDILGLYVEVRELMGFMTERGNVALDALFAACIDVPHGASADVPAKGGCVKGAGGRLIFAANLEVHNRMVHPASLSWEVGTSLMHLD